jgi:hypothetical protein
MGRLLAVFYIVCAVWVIYHVWTKNRQLTDTEKLIWTISAVVFSFLTAVIYYVVQKRRRY